MFEVAVVTILTLIILILGVIAVQKIFKNQTVVAMFKNTNYAYGMFSFLELQEQGKTDFSKYAPKIPETTVLGKDIPTSYRFFGITISDLPKSYPKYDKIFTVGRVYYQFREYTPHTRSQRNKYWICLKCLVDVASKNSLTVVYNNGTLFRLLSGDSYEVNVFPVFSDKTFSKMGKDFFIPNSGFGVFTITNKKKEYIDGSIREWKASAFYWPDSKPIDYESDPDYGKTMTLFAILRSAYPFNTLNTVEQFYWTESDGFVVVATSRFETSETLKSFLDQNGDPTNGSVVEINNRDYTIITNALSIYSFSTSMNARFTLDAYLGEIKIEDPRSTTGITLRQNARIIYVAPPLGNDYFGVGALKFNFEPVYVKIIKQKKYWVFTVKKGVKYTVIDFDFSK